MLLGLRFVGVEERKIMHIFNRSILRMEVRQRVI